MGATPSSINLVLTPYNSNENCPQNNSKRARKGIGTSKKRKPLHSQHTSRYLLVLFKVRRILRDVDQSIAASLPLLRDVYCEVVNGKIS